MAKKSSSKAVKKTAPKAAIKNAAKKAVKKSVKKAAPAPAKKQASKNVSKSAKSGNSSSSTKSISKNKNNQAVKKIKNMAVNNKLSKKATNKDKVKSVLSKKELEEFRRILIEKRKGILGDMAGMRGSSMGMNLQDSAGDLSNMPTHLADIGSDNFEHEFTLELLESERDLLREIDEALDRIDDGTFGICLGTGQPISIARLKARPWCRYSIEYKRMIEKGLAAPRHSSDDEEHHERDDEE
mgnify:CR=1 FL=1